MIRNNIRKRPDLFIFVLFLSKKIIENTKCALFASIRFLTLIEALRPHGPHGVKLFGKMLCIHGLMIHRVSLKMFPLEKITYRKLEAKYKKSRWNDFADIYRIWAKISQNYVNVENDLLLT